MMKKFVFLSVLFLSVLFCSPLSADTLVTYTHNYGYGDGRVDPGGEDPLSSNYVTVKDKDPKTYSRFYDSFSFSGLTYSSIDQFALTLSFSGAGPSYSSWWIFTWATENWYVRPGAAPSPNPQYQLQGSGSSVNTFIVNSDLQPQFNNMVASRNFSFWFAEETGFPNEFQLYSATLEIQGTPAQNPNPNPVPEPGSIILLGTGLLGMATITRYRSKR